MPAGAVLSTSIAAIRAARWAALTASLLVVTASASAAPFAPATSIGGFGNQAGLAQISGAALAANGASVIAGSSDNAGNRRAVAAFGSATSARGFGPTSGAYDVSLAANAAGNAALTFSVGHRAYLVTCHDARCRPTARVGTSALKPQSDVAVQPGTGRTIVLWRGRTSHGANRLQWRITTNGKLGRTHSLGEFGDTPRLATDASGKTVAVWLAGRRGVRTAARRVGEFLKPASVTRSVAGALRLVSSDGGSVVAAWLAGPNGLNPESPGGTVQIATRTRSTSFRAPQSLGTGSTLSLAGSPDGHVALATDRHVGATSVVVAAARRAPGGSFGPLVDLSPAQFVSDAYGAQAAVADGGRALVAWASGVDPSANTPAGVFAVLAAPTGGFGAPELLAAAPAATLPQPTGAAITSSAAVVAWTGPEGGQLARAGG
jgi:hypothetical protein